MDPFLYLFDDYIWYLRTVNSRHVRQGGEANQYSNFKQFQDTKPPVFKEASEPLETNEWLNTLEQKFYLLRVTEELKTKYAAHQLEGKASVWWSHHRATMPDNAVVTYDLVKTAFRDTYIPLGLMTIKHTEFMNLTQGTKSLTEYLHAFNNLSHYATKLVDTDAKKLASFKRGLGPKLSTNMVGNKSTTFNVFVSDALTQENANAIYAASKNRKRAYEAGASQSKAPVATKPAYRPPNGVIGYKPPHKKSNVKTGVRKSFTLALPRGATSQGSSNTPTANRPYFNSKHRKSFTLALPRGATSQGSSNTPTANRAYFNSKQVGYWARYCPYPKRNSIAGGNVRPGRVHYTTIEEIPIGEVVTTGMFLVNQHLAVVLLDSRASHSFMSQAFASKHGQNVVDIDKGKFCITAAGNQISTNQLVRNAHLAIEGHNYSADLVILPGLGIDVILGMNKMSGHGVLIDTSTRVIMLREPDSKETFLVQLPRDDDIRNAANAIRPLTVVEIPLVCEFPECFSRESTWVASGHRHRV